MKHTTQVQKNRLVLLAHIAKTHVCDDQWEEIVVALCKNHSDSLIEEKKSLHCDRTCYCMVQPGAVENTWDYKFNRCELCESDKDKDFLRS